MLRPILALPESVVHRIAAGEICQRPVNALKELIENALDADATRIIVSLKDGGLSQMIIEDNGHGIRFADLPLLCRRFSTSKLATYDDLLCMRTYGFRGEALASISHVARVTVTTRTAESEVAFRAWYIDGELAPSRPGMSDEPQACAGNKGTIIQIDDLFYNYSARKMQMMHNAGEEYKRCVDLMEKMALHFPHISFVLKKIGTSKQSLCVDGCASVLARAGKLYGNTISKELLPFSYTQSAYGLSMSGLVSNPSYSDLLKPVLIVFINNRLVHCQPVQKAVEQIYASILPKHRYSWAYVALSLDPKHVDVNVHPTKETVHLANETEIIHELCCAIQSALASSASSRVFKACLPRNDILSSVQECKSTKIELQVAKEQMVRPSQLNRTDSSQLDLFTTGQISRQLKSPHNIISKNGPMMNKLSGTLLSALAQSRALESIKNASNSSLTELLRHHVHVGFVSWRWVLIQFQLKLLLMDMVSISCEFFTQAVVRLYPINEVFDFAACPSIAALLKMAVRVAEGQNDIDDAHPRLLGAIRQFTAFKPLLESFGFRFVEEDDTIVLKSLPLLLHGYIPPLGRLPALLLSLSECNIAFNDNDNSNALSMIARILGTFWAVNEPALYIDKRPEEVQSMIASTLLPSLKSSEFHPPALFRGRHPIIELTTVTNLYKVFERC